ncbi:ketopantoate reductase PanE/ApbA C terminal-domain-containing protein [Penicillium malachiteum]|nr:ketopantoate reductase PanE/ApbA C terminal-domain-containing protein [Penicillium malachiteum]
MANPRANILLCGCGAVGTTASVTLEKSGCAAVTAVLRSNFSKVKKDGFSIDSVDHGKLSGWRPSYISGSVQDAIKNEPFQFIIVALKSLPDIYSIPQPIAPAITPFESTIVLIQNGIGNEQSFIDAFPNSTILFGVSMIGAHQLDSGVIKHNGPDLLHLGPVYTAAIPRERQDELATEFSSLYRSGGASCLQTDNIIWMRCKKLVWNPLSTVFAL